MSALRNAAERLANLGRFPNPNPDRRLDCEKVAAKLEGREVRQAETSELWDDFLRRIGLIEG